jgi:hypothetical protein
MNQEQDSSWLREVRDALFAGELVDPPEWVRERARRLFETRATRTSTSLMGRLRATLVFDSRRMGVAQAGVRSVGLVDGPWQLLYRGGDIDVDLLVRPNKDGRTLTVRGQALALAGAKIGVGVVEALPADVPRRLDAPDSGRASARSALEPSGEFALGNLERGRYDVLLRFGAREIELSDLEL